MSLRNIMNISKVTGSRKWLVSKKQSLIQGSSCCKQLFLECGRVDFPGGEISYKIPHQHVYTGWPQRSSSLPKYRSSPNLSCYFGQFRPPMEAHT